MHVMLHVSNAHDSACACGFSHAASHAHEVQHSNALHRRNVFAAVILTQQSATVSTASPVAGQPWMQHGHLCQLAALLSFVQTYNCSLFGN
jgi:hypothetical protein